MAWHLYRLGRTAFRNKWKVLVGWILLLAVVTGGAATLGGATQDSFSLPGLESTEAFDLISDRTPQAAPDGATARIVFQSQDGSPLTGPAERKAIAKSLETLATDQVIGVGDPFEGGTVSEDGTTAYAVVNYDVNSIGLTDATTDALQDSRKPAEDAGLEVAVGGDALQEIPVQGAGELIGVLIAAMILASTFGSLVAAGMPLVSAVVGVGIGIGGIMIATGFMDLGSTTPILASMLGLAVGIDYALFIVSRFRQEVKDGRSLEDAAGLAVGTAGSAVVFAGLTVIIALAGLSVVNIRFLTEMGLAAALTVLLSVLIALTLLPALLGIFGRRITRPSRLRILNGGEPRRAGGARMGRRWVDLVTRFKVPALLLGVATAAVLAIPASSLQLALPDDGTQPEGSGPRVAYDTISEKFGAGVNGPLLVVVDTLDADDPETAVASVQKAVQGVQDDVAAVVPAEPVQPGVDYTTITVIPESGPADGSTMDLVADIRSAVDDAEATTGADVYVTGQTALGVDVSQKLADVFPIYLAVVVGLAFLLLVFVFRSVLVPLKAVLGFLVSVGVSLGATVAVFQWGWLAELVGVDKSGPILALLPILLVGILFGLAMDYEVFLVSRMHEEYSHGATPLDAVRNGFAHGARVVTAAALIMIAVFVSFAATADAIVKTIAFGLAVGVLTDAFLVRMTLVPAFMAMVGKASWWLPGWLGKILPNLNIEGDALQRQLSAAAVGADSGTQTQTGAQTKAGAGEGPPA